ncbi:hypothetical protein RYH73_02735 [Olivibacter sp. CPCC 100613]|uniref:hypothetical protein n=1 Tax=Olivibacter sp. CPCC 100613 TaxID=3079931 RepID=UPI002FF6AF3E
MSSHHIVKEQQEPALIVDFFQDLDLELLGQLLEWAPTVIANQESAQWLSERNIHVDVVLGVGDHHGIKQDGLTFLRGNSASFKEIALNYLVEKGYQAVNILSQELPIDLFHRFTSLINLVFINGERKVFAIKSGFKKWKPAGEVIHILANETLFQTKGLKKEGHQQYQTTKDGFFEIHFQTAHLLIAENL